MAICMCLNFSCRVVVLVVCLMISLKENHSWPVIVQMVTDWKASSQFQLHDDVLEVHCVCYYGHNIRLINVSF